MAIANVSTILSSEKFVIKKILIVGDAGSDLTNYEIYDYSTDDPIDSNLYLALYDVQYELNGFTASISFGASTNQVNVTMEDSHYDHANYEWFGGIHNKDLANRNGKVLLSTNGCATGDFGYIIVNIVKR